MTRFIIFERSNELLLSHNCKKYAHTYEYEYHISPVMQILIPSTSSAVTIFLILSSPYDYICLTSLKITSTQGRLCVPSVTSSMNSLSSSSFNWQLDTRVVCWHHGLQWNPDLRPKTKYDQVCGITFHVLKS